MKKAYLLLREIYEVNEIRVDYESGLFYIQQNKDVEIAISLEDVKDFLPIFITELKEIINGKQIY